MRYILTLIGLFALTAIPLVAADIFPPIGSHSADLLVLGMPKEAEEIGRRLQQALAADPTWLKSYLAGQNLKPGDILPYNVKFGITKDEYALFVRSMDKMTLNKVGEVIVHVKKLDNKEVISIEGVTLPVNTFEFSADGETMTCALGHTTEQTTIDQSDATSPTGKWHGTQWALQQGEPNTNGTDDFLSLKLAIGVDAMDRNLLYLRIVGRQQGQGIEVGTVARWANN
jgi:hypothetical protein